MSDLRISNCATPALAQQIHVTDGDTIKVDTTTYRLWGIDAWRDDYPAEAKATATLEYLMEDRAVTCEDRGHDRYDRTIALCRADGRDLGAELMRLGMAYASTKYNRDYVGEERLAERERLGVHAMAVGGRGFGGPRMSETRVSPLAGRRCAAMWRACDG